MNYNQECTDEKLVEAIKNKDIIVNKNGLSVRCSADDKNRGYWYIDIYDNELFNRCISLIRDEKINIILDDQSR